VAVKATGQAGYAEDEYPFRTLHPHLHRCFDGIWLDSGDLRFHRCGVERITPAGRML